VKLLVFILFYMMKNAYFYGSLYAISTIHCILYRVSSSGFLTVQFLDMNCLLHCFVSLLCMCVCRAEIGRHNDLFREFI